jgi:2-C-methyl-D-erythritol 4-phosphate cytidylyltransferase
MADDQAPIESTDAAVLVPAAGEGHRLGGSRKQFRVLGDRPLLLQVLLVFERHPAVQHLVVAAPDDHVQDVSDRLQAEGLSTVTVVVSGGASRQASVRHALRAVPSFVNIVLVHDAARPFLRPADVDAVLTAVRRHGAASLALPVADTLRNASGDVFGDTVPREGLYRVQTPQGFRRDWLEDAHRLAAEADDASATDDAGLVQRVGRKVHLVRGDRRNFKITDPGDWQMAQQLWPSWRDDLERSASSD